MKIKANQEQVFPRGRDLSIWRGIKHVAINVNQKEEAVRNTKKTKNRNI